MVLDLTNPDVQSLADAFSNATGNTFREQIGAEVFQAKLGVDTKLRTQGELSAAIELKFQQPGVLVVSMSPDTAFSVAERMLISAGVTPDEAMVCDCLGEIANIIAGQAKAYLLGTSQCFTHATPSIIKGIDQVVGTWNQGDLVQLQFESEFGTFSIQVCRKR